MSKFKAPIIYQLNNRGLTLLSFVVLASIWCLLSYGGIVKDIFLPTPGAVFSSFGEMHREGILIHYTLASTYRVMVGWALAVITAIPIGMLIGTSRKAEALFEPTVDFARYLPVVALVPLTLLYFGIGDLQKFAVIFLGTFFQLVLLVSDAAAGVPKDLLRAASTLGATKWQSYRMVLIPASLPGIMDSLRITIGWAWTYLVVAEMVAANSGLGYMILRAQRFLAVDRIFAGLIIIGLLGLVTDHLFKLITEKAVPWSEKGGARK
ncbi:MAG: ABC transporter permease [Clostridiales bacterium]|nr:ABC transporter permease [Clostridiales bacterium]MCF8022827.1 ABC transporter permease [Clostridiales bacterium]